LFWGHGGQKFVLGLNDSLAAHSRLASPSDADRADYLVIEHDQVIGRIYEECYVPEDVRWFWSITVYVDPALRIATNGRVPTLEEATSRFESSWSRVSEANKQKERRP
jgi:hypothetical protein